MKAREFYNENERIAVVTTEPFARFLDYLAPEGGCKIGSFLILPLGKRKVIGVVWGPGDGQYDHSKLRCSRLACYGESKRRSQGHSTVD